MENYYRSNGLAQIYHFPVLIERILAGYSLNPWGTHGLSHWARVLENGYRLAETTGANLEVLTLFAIFHDARRRNDAIDPGHGERGADLARRLRGSMLHVADDDFSRLELACAQHTHGGVTDDITIQTCWDADRLDLPRAGIRVRPERLSTNAARNPAILSWAAERSISRVYPDWMWNEWGLPRDHSDRNFSQTNL